MRPVWGLLALGAFGLAACGQTGSPGQAQGGMAASGGSGFCQAAPPEDLSERARWNDKCFPGGNT